MLESDAAALAAMRNIQRLINRTPTRHTSAEQCLHLNFHGLLLDAPTPSFMEATAFLYKSLQIATWKVNTLQSTVGGFLFYPHPSSKV